MRMLFLALIMVCAVGCGAQLSMSSKSNLPSECSAMSSDAATAYWTVASATITAAHTSAAVDPAKYQLAHEAAQQAVILLDGGSAITIEQLEPYSLAIQALVSFWKPADVIDSCIKELLKNALVQI